MTSVSPSYEEWIEFCFKDGYAWFNGKREVNPKFEIDNPVLVTEYLTRLFENPAFIAQRYDRHEIAEAIWFIFGVGSGYCSDMREPMVPPEKQIKCIHTVGIFYQNLLDKICNRDGTMADVDVTNTDDVDKAVYMIWDMDGLECGAMERKYAYLASPILSVLDSILSLRTSTCLKSALHGLGHIASCHPENVSRIVNDFLHKQNDSPEWLRQYARQARKGVIQ